MEKLVQRAFFLFPRVRSLLFTSDMGNETNSLLNTILAPTAYILSQASLIMLRVSTQELPATAS